MEGDIFFLSWVLWQQMTFVLAMAILAVFCAGLVKLWWITRLMKKQEVLDEEKKARVEEMRRTGIPVKRANDIPFGIRAIQSGVEVAGIWISRPESPHQATPPKLPSVTVINLDADKGTDSSDDPKTLPISAARGLSAGGSIFQKLADADSTDGSQSTGPPVSQFAPRTQRRGPRGVNMLSEDTLRKLEGQSRQKPYETYVPMSAPQNPRHLSQRSSESSSGESMDSQPRSIRSASGRSYTSSRSSRLYMARHFRDGRATYSGMPHGWQLEESRDPFGTPARTYSGFSALSQGEAYGIPLQSRELSTPEPTFGPGDVHANRKARRVNDGFEILPAGTFTLGKPDAHTASSNTDASESLDHNLNTTKTPKKLRKKSIGQLQESGHGLNQVS